ncbi:MAG: NfeD family protein [Cyanobacteria bacterium P01_H01_bin.121]
MATTARPDTAIEMFAEPGTGTVDEIITPTIDGRVKYHASYWPARLHRPQGHWVLAPGTQVKVLGRDNITLLVSPEQPE